jgi:hypothetical protein
MMDLEKFDVTEKERKGEENSQESGQGCYWVYIISDMTQKAARSEEIGR